MYKIMDRHNAVNFFTIIQLRAFYIDKIITFAL